MPAINNLYIGWRLGAILRTGCVGSGRAEAEETG